MNLKLCAIAATVCGLRSLEHPRSIKSRLIKSGHQGQSVSKQSGNLDSNSILANYNRAFVVESNLK